MTLKEFKPSTVEQVDLLAAVTRKYKKVVADIKATASGLEFTDLGGNRYRVYKIPAFKAPVIEHI